MNEDISRRLREAAAAHQPDRARMLARVELARDAHGASRSTAPHRTLPLLRSWPKAALACLATAGILATGGFAVAGIVRTPPPSDAPTAPAAPSPTGTSPSASPATAPPPRTSAPSPSDGPAPAAPTPGGSRPTPSANSRVQSGPLWSDGSIDPHSSVYWAQSNVTLRTAQPLTSLTVEVRIAQTGGVRDTGNWRTLPSDDFSVTVQETGSALVYRWVLKPGRTVPTGQHMFAAQYNHATGVRSAADDSYRVDAQSADSAVGVWGGFSRAG
ncbi:hypothetical protein AMK16_25415 [Streptomyces sp. CB00455]|uniref:hypothetical protein n=1 Tax=Streptomyces sp. CB00455 TaxID=1703927 RepID=UPI00093AFCB7|nr:hypothetical protein [Streptomyces sp. CB00455]OKK16068.1 hypothetical protein AMK16_25415 [Streptomyces sp. CB00455]